MFSSSIPVKELVKRTPPQTSRGLGGSSNKDKDVSIESLKKTPQNQNINQSNNKTKDTKTGSQGKKRSKKGKNKQKKVTEDSPEKVDDGQRLADEALMKELHLSSSESEIEEKKRPEIKENQLKRGMSSDSEEDSQVKKVKSEGQDKQQADEIEMSDEEINNQNDEPEVEPEEVQESTEDMNEPYEEDGDSESFLYLKCTDTDITSLSAYRATAQIHNVLHREAKIVKVNRCLRVTCIRREERDRLKQLRFIVGHPVEVTEPFTKVNKPNLSNRGIIFGVEDDITNEELSNALGVRAERIIKRRGGAMVRTAQVILHFEGPMLEYVRLGWKRHRVSPYIPEPVRCFKCQRYGHIASNCSSREAEMPHLRWPASIRGVYESKDHRTEKKAVCPNCRGPHPASYQGCPAFKQAKVIRKIQANEGISYADAVKKHKAAANHPTNQPTDVHTRPADVTGNPQSATDQHKLAQPAKQANNVTAAPPSESRENNNVDNKQIETVCNGILDFLQKFTSALTVNSSDDDLRTTLKKLADNFSTCIPSLILQI